MTNSFLALYICIISDRRLKGHHLLWWMMRSWPRNSFINQNKLIKLLRNSSRQGQCHRVSGPLDIYCSCLFIIIICYSILLTFVDGCVAFLFRSKEQCINLQTNMCICRWYVSSAVQRKCVLPKKTNFHRMKSIWKSISLSGTKLSAWIPLGLWLLQGQLV